MSRFTNMLAALLLAVMSSQVLAGDAAPTPMPAPPAGPEPEALTGQELLDECSVNASPGSPNQYCMRYIFGLVQVVDSFQNADPSSRKIFCIDPNQVGLQEVTERTTNWLKSVPDRLGEDAYKLVTESLHKNYPCG